MEQEEIVATVEWLVDDWCEVRKLIALRHILAAYPMRGTSKQDWNDLRDALRKVDSACAAELSAAESDRLHVLVAALDRLAAG